ncbi:hypothetical protein [Streptococcus minor]|uniref:hypothetical protein n=1 Tax=Streptococcus minor TaxID=229549 RepID=UPI00036DF3E7|nr:hypothetical protein [Streptococcus minor]
MNQKNKDRDSSQAPHTLAEHRRIGRTTYYIYHSFTGKRPLEKVLERLILSDKSLF